MDEWSHFHSSMHPHSRSLSLTCKDSFSALTLSVSSCMAVASCGLMSPRRDTVARAFFMGRPWGNGREGGKEGFREGKRR